MKNLPSILKEVHNLDINSRDVNIIQNKTIFIGKGMYDNFVSVCSEGRADYIEELTGNVMIMSNLCVVRCSNLYH